MNSHVNDLVTSSLAPSHSHNDDRDFGFEPHERGISNTLLCTSFILVCEFMVYTTKVVL